MLHFNLIAAVCENYGIGFRGNLPWQIKSELKYFSCTTKRRFDASKRNVVIMGRKTYYGVPPSKRPLPERLNVILSSTLKPDDLPSEVLVFTNLEGAMQQLEEQIDQIENVWIVGGSNVYAEALASARCHRLYLTKIYAQFDCDTFFPSIPESFREVSADKDTPIGIQEENGLKYEYKVLEKQK